jgi:hypothetical protein
VEKPGEKALMESASVAQRLFEALEQSLGGAAWKARR